MNKKSAALIIALLIISAVAIFAFTAARSIVVSIAQTSRDSDAMIAAEAARGGLEYGLLQGWCNSPTVDRGWGTNPDYTSPNLGSGQKFEVWWAVSDQVFPWPGKGCEIKSVGSIGSTYSSIASTYKTEVLKFNGGFIQSACSDLTNYCSGHCGQLPQPTNDVCGNPIPNCGGCSVGFTCTNNTCVATCQESNAAFCLRLGKTCGPVSGTDKCGNPRSVTSCGTCGTGKVCTNNVCVASGACPSGQHDPHLICGCGGSGTCTCRDTCQLSPGCGIDYCSPSGGANSCTRGIGQACTQGAQCSCQLRCNLTTHVCSP